MRIVVFALLLLLPQISRVEGQNPVRLDTLPPPPPIPKQAIGNTREEQNSTTPQSRRLLHHRMLVEVQRELQKADAAFYSINPSGPGLRLNIISQRAQDGMEQLATSTGGTSFVPEKLSDLDAVFRQIAAELRSQYLLQYYSKSEAPIGTFLPIGVQVPQQVDLRVRARQGYYVKRK